MKKIILVSLAGLTLVLAGCTQQVPTTNQDTDQPTANINQNINQAVVNQNQNTDKPVANINQSTANVNQNVNTNKPIDLTANWKSYQNNNFNVKYPAYLSPKVKPEGAKTTVSFQGKVTPQSYESLLSIALMPNQGGVTLDGWTNEVISQSRWIKQGSIKISGQTAYILTLPETDAGSRYVFLSNDSKTIFDMTIQYFDQETTDLIISSFLLLGSANECANEQDCINLGKCDQRLECTCYKNKCYTGYVAPSNN